MSQTANMTVNQLPAPTYNWLHMNEAKVSQEDITKEAAVEREVPAGVSLKVLDTPSMTEVKSGVGADLDAVMANVAAHTFAVEAGTKISEPIRLHFMYKDGEAAGSIHEITLGDDAEATVIMYFDAEEEAAGTAASQIKYRLGERALLHIVQVQKVGKKMRFFNDIGGTHKDRSRYELIQVVLAGKETYLGSYSDMSGYKSTIKTDTAYLVQNEEKLDMNFVAYQTGRKTNSEMNASGVLRDHAKKLYRGTIDFRRGAAGAVGAEKEDVLLMDDDVVNQTIPLILCDEEDVEGTHGATIGKLDDELMFYLESRGIDRENIYEMMARARIEAVSHQIADKKTRQIVEDFLDR